MTEMIREWILTSWMGSGKLCQHLWCYMLSGATLHPLSKQTAKWQIKDYLQTNTVKTSHWDLLETFIKFSVLLLDDVTSWRTFEWKSGALVSTQITHLQEAWHFRNFLSSDYCSVYLAKLTVTQKPALLTKSNTYCDMDKLFLVSTFHYM